MSTGTTRDLDGHLIALVGGSGYFGAHLAQELLGRGARLRICSRHPERGFRLKPLAGLGQIQLVAADITKPHTLEAALKGCDSVVNLVGVFTGDLDAVQGAGAGRLAAIAKTHGAKAFVQISAIGANAGSDVPYARTKAAGEAAVLDTFPGATILRPSIIFGEDDNFINMFAGLISKLPVVPVFGPSAPFQPVHVDDAAQAVGNVLAAPAAHAGKTYELGGPEVITMGDLNRRIAKAAQRTPLFLDLPDGVSSAFASATGWLPGAPLSRNQWTLLKAGNTTSAAMPGMAELGVLPRPLELFLDRWMVRYRKHGRFAAKAA